MEFSSIEEVLAYNDEQCQGAVSAFRRELLKVRTGRASAGLVEGIVVDYYGAKTPLNNLGQISTPEARLISIQVYDTNAVQAIEKAIHSSGLGLNPASEGNVIRINIPPLTEESRKDLIRHLHKLAEDIRISVRNHRRDANDAIKKMEKASDITKDDAKRAQDEVQKQTDVFTKEIQTILDAKEAEVMEV